MVDTHHRLDRLHLAMVHHLDRLPRAIDHLLDLLILAMDRPLDRHPLVMERLLDLLLRDMERHLVHHLLAMPLHLVLLITAPDSLVNNIINNTVSRITLGRARTTRTTTPLLLVRRRNSNTALQVASHIDLRAKPSTMGHITKAQITKITSHTSSIHSVQAKRRRFV